MKKLFIFLLVSAFTTGLFAQNYVEIKTSELPKNVKVYLDKTLKTYTLGRAVKADENGVTKYAVVAEMRGRKSVFVFDKNGKFLSREKDLKGLKQAKPTPPVTPKK